MSQEYVLVGATVLLLVGIIFALVREWKKFPSVKAVSAPRTLDAEAVQPSVVELAVATENASAVVRAPEGNVKPKEDPGRALVPGKHGRGTRRVEFVGVDATRGMARVKFPGDPTVHRRPLSVVRQPASANA